MTMDHPSEAERPVTAGMEKEMKFKQLLFAIFSLVAISICGCGTNGGSGLNGSVLVTTLTTGSVITATATYSDTSPTNTTPTSVIGVPITFTAAVGSQSYNLGTFHTNSLGVASVVFTPPAFSGTQTITVIAKADNIVGSSSVIMTGRSMTVTSPPPLTLTTSNPSGTAISFSIPFNANFVTIADPFNNDLSGHVITISASVVPTNVADTLVPPTTTTTNSSGVAPFPGATGTIIVPATVGGVETMIITWTVTDTVTGQSGTGVTTVTLTKTS